MVEIHPQTAKNTVSGCIFRAKNSSANRLFYCLRIDLLSQNWMRFLIMIGLPAPAKWF
jgi:hypothetical protein